MLDIERQIFLSLKKSSMTLLTFKVEIADNASPRFDLMSTGDVYQNNYFKFEKTKHIFPVQSIVSF